MKGQIRTLLGDSDLNIVRQGMELAESQEKDTPTFINELLPYFWCHKGGRILQERPLAHHDYIAIWASAWRKRHGLRASSWQKMCHWRYKELSQSEVLNCSRRNLSALPEALGDLRSLKRLLLSQNELRDLPKGISKLSTLEELQLQYNKLSVLPEWLLALPHLQRLELEANEIIELPDVSLLGPHFKSINLSENRISSLPSALCQASSKLKSFRIHRNPLCDFPDDFWKIFARLRIATPADQEVFIDLSPDEVHFPLNHRSCKQMIKSLPPGLTVPESLYTQASLHQVRAILHKAQFDCDFASRLQYLNLSSAQLTHLPNSLGVLSKLTQLDLSRNPLCELPESFFQMEKLQTVHLSADQKTLAKTLAIECPSIRVVISP